MPTHYIPARVVRGKSRWYIVYYQTDPLDGQRKRFRETFDLNRIHSLRDRERYARRLIDHINSRLPKGYPFTEREKLMSVPISVAIKKAADIKCRTDRRKTREYYHYTYTQFLTWLKSEQLDERPVAEFDRKDALQFLDYILLERKVANRTWNNYMTAMRSMFYELLDREYVTDNPFSGIKKRKTPKKRRRSFSSKEKSIVSAEIYERDKWLMLAVLLIYHCFVRPIELRRLRFQHFDLEDGTINMPAEVTKNKKSSIVTIPDVMLTFFPEVEWDSWPGHYLIFGRLGAPHPKKACGHHTLLRRHQDILKDLHARNKLSDITGLSLYSWKDTGVLDLSKANVNILETQKQLRHSNLQTTQVYTQSLSDRNEAIKKAEVSILPDHKKIPPT